MPETLLRGNVVTDNLSIYIVNEYKMKFAIIDKIIWRLSVFRPLANFLGFLRHSVLKLALFLVVTSKEGKGSNSEGRLKGPISIAELLLSSVTSLETER
jgi:hypothetical protein